MTPVPDRILSPSDYARFAEALIALGVAAMAVKLPFRLVVRLMSLNRGASSVDDLAASDVIRAIKRASRRVPWRTVCLDEGLASHWMLRLRGIQSVLHYGIGSGPEELTAHVWVTLEGKILIGAEEAGRHALVASFPEN